MSPIAIHRKPRVFSLHPLDPESHALSKQLFDFTAPGEKGFDNWREEAEGIMVRGSAVTAEDVALFGPKLKFIGKHGVGVDRLDLKALKTKGVTVMNTPGVNAGSVAELAFGLAMGVARQIPLIDRRIRAGDTVTKADGGALGIQLAGRTLGLVGGGNIGFHLGKMFNGAFDSPIIIYDPFLSPAMADKWADLIPAHRLTVVDSLEEMLRHSDIVSLHIPLNDQTRDLIGKKELDMMKPSAILINTARGGIVDEDAIIEALDRGHLQGVGLDAFTVEPPTVDSLGKLISHPRVISTPHIGAASLDVIRMTAMSVIDHLAEALSGKEPRDVVV